jgi:hypothetical protein
MTKVFRCSEVPSAIPEVFSIVYCSNLAIDGTWLPLLFEALQLVLLNCRQGILTKHTVSFDNEMDVWWLYARKTITGIRLYLR